MRLTAFLGALCLLVGASGLASAAEGETRFGFVTQDPFLAPGESPKKNDVTIFGGAFVTDTFGGAAEFWRANYTDNYMVGVAYGHDAFDLGAGFLLGGVIGVAGRFGSDDATTGEVWAGLRLRHQGLLLGDLLISPGVTVGFSAVSAPTEIERRREIYYDGDASFLGMISPEIAFRLRTLPNAELVTQIHHRSGGGGTFGDMGEGSNNLGIGLRIKF